MCRYAKSANIQRVPSPAPRSWEILSVGQDPEIRSSGEADFPMILRIQRKIRDQSGSGPDFRQENESPNLESRVLRVYSRKNIESGIDQFIFDRDHVLKIPRRLLW
ncbi:Hypothetical_protein [Hexamita inflata]|uniref:Hypothetical_protein n=1 Tax=Hexamita inflata TaxID=28002 RepID=A0AA86NR63_9EUKA|nr:Hypothetical protein HINF_LOCUS11513 [Hexamita inflata]